MTHPSSTLSVERGVAGLSLIVAPALLLLADLIDSRPSEESVLATAAQAPGRHQAWAMVGLFAVVLLVPATLALVRLLRPGRPLVARLGAVATSPIVSDPISVLALGWVGVIVLRMPQTEWDRPARVIPEARLELSDQVGTVLR